MQIQFEVDYPKQFPWLRPLIESEYSEVLKKAIEGQKAHLGRMWVTEDVEASGETFKAFQITEVVHAGDRMSIELYPRGDRAQIVSYIEWGRGSGRMPPSNVIRQWLFDKGIAKEGDDERLINTLTWSVMKTIGHEGIEPRHILERSERQYRPSIVRMFEAATRRLAAKINANLTMEHN
jgi:hypothetical protein